MAKVTKKVKNSNDYSFRYLLNWWTFCSQNCYGDASSWSRLLCKKIGLLSSSSGLQWGLIWCNMIVSTTSAELLIFLHSHLICIWWYIIISWSVLCFFFIAVYKVRVIAMVWNLNEYLFRWYLLNHLTFCNQTWYGGVWSWAGASSRNIVLLIKVKVTGRACIIKIWLFLLYLLNFWYVCN